MPNVTGHPTPLPPQPRFQWQGEALLVRAAAKINLNLLVGPVRTNGYHPVDSYVARVTLYDELRLRSTNDGVVHLDCRGADCGAVEENLAYRAARLLMDHCRVNKGVEIGLSKRIPPGKGLGGGSSDAAAALLGLNALWNLNQPLPTLAEWAAQLGSDVPLFLSAPVVRMTGRGEIVEPLGDDTIYPFVAILFLPDIFCGTKEVYQAFDRCPAVMSNQLSVSLLRQKPSRWRHLLDNQLLPPARQVSPAVGRMLKEIAHATRVPISMSGSGSAAFILCDDAAEASALLGRLPSPWRDKALLVSRDR